MGRPKHGADIRGEERSNTEKKKFFIDRKAEAKKQSVEYSYPERVLNSKHRRLLAVKQANGMGDFLNEMVTMMSQTKPNENGEESFEELQQLFEDMFQEDIGSDGSTSLTAAGCSTSSTYMTYSETSNSNKRNSTEMNFGKPEDFFDFDASYQNFCLGVKHLQDIKKGKGEILEEGGSSRHRRGRKQKISYGQDVSSNDYPGISTK